MYLDRQGFENRIFPKHEANILVYIIMRWTKYKRKRANLYEKMSWIEVKLNAMNHNESIRFFTCQTKYKIPFNWHYPRYVLMDFLITGPTLFADPYPKWLVQKEILCNSVTKIISSNLGFSITSIFAWQIPKWPEYDRTCEYCRLLLILAKNDWMKSLIRKTILRETGEAPKLVRFEIYSIE